MAKIVIKLDSALMDVSDDKDAVDCLKVVKDGSDREILLSKQLANLLKGATDGDALKHLDWSIDLYRTGKIEVDPSDYDYLEGFIKGNKQVPALVKGQLIRIFRDAKNPPAVKPAPAAEIAGH